MVANELLQFVLAKYQKIANHQFFLAFWVSFSCCDAAHEYGAPYFHQVCCDFVVLLSCRGFAKTVGGILAYIYLLLLLCTVERKN